MAHEEVILHSTTGIDAIDRILAGIVDLCEFVFPGRIKSYLLLGSYSDGSAVRESDLDICMLFKSRVQDEERQRFMRLMRACQNLCTVRLDLAPLDERHLQVGVSAAIKEALVIYGANLSSEPLLAVSNGTNRRFWRD
jgi:predicted nucleotidyltransferase